MARARNLKPGFFRDAKVVSCSFQARILFQGLWCMADYMGRLKYNPMEVKMEIFPADDVDVPACMEELNSTGLITMYHDCSGAALVQVTNFTKHQNPHVNERQDRNKNPIPCLPGPDEVAGSDDEEGEEKPTVEQRVRDALVVLREYSESDPADSLNLIPDSPFPLPDSGSPRTDPPPPAGSAGKQRKSTPKAKLTKTDLINDFEIPEDLAVQFLQIRKDKRLTLTPRAMDGLLREFEKVGLSVVTGIELCCRKSWGAFNADWDWQGGGSGRSGQPHTGKHTGFADQEFTEHLPDWAKEA